MLIDGKQLAEQILENLQERVAKLQEEKHVTPHVAIIRVGDDPATTSYVKQKERMGKQIGAVVSTYNYTTSISEKEILESIHFLQTQGDIHGLIVQLPLPHHLNTETLTNAVELDKDVDGFLENSEFNEPIAEAVIRILGEIHILDQGKKEFSQEMKVFKTWLQQQHIVIMGKGKTGGKPVIEILKKLHVPFTVVDSKTPNREEITREADILVCAVGKGKIITEGMIKEDAILIGIGMHRESDGKLHGDYDAEDIKDKAAYYTPIPGGVGPVNAAMLLVNVVDAAEKAS
jgi:methylenetetrahydrofolate dehydrogenase (NADP+) / methenyltetrahydrofolate cyclohydrolase